MNNNTNNNSSSIGIVVGAIGGGALTPPEEPAILSIVLLLISWLFHDDEDVPTRNKWKEVPPPLPTTWNLLSAELEGNLLNGQQNNINDYDSVNETNGSSSSNDHHHEVEGDNILMMMTLDNDGQIDGDGANFNEQNQSGVECGVREIAALKAANETAIAAAAAMNCSSPVMDVPFLAMAANNGTTAEAGGGEWHEEEEEADNNSNDNDNADGEDERMEMMLMDGGGRLPDTIQPIQYDIRLTLDSNTELVQGQVQIELECRRPTARIQLHLAPDFVQLDHALLESRHHNNNNNNHSSSSSSDRLSLPFRFVQINWRAQLLTLWMAKPLASAHVYYLSIWFVARYTSDGRGLSRHREKDRGIWLNTLFEPAYARRLFPCWDEPRFRSAFRLELWLLNRFADDDYRALTSMDGRCERWHANLSICQFPPTPPIQTYLLTIAVGRFHAVCENISRVVHNNKNNKMDGRNDVVFAIGGKHPNPAVEPDRAHFARNVCVWHLVAERQQNAGKEANDDDDADNYWMERAHRTIQTMAKFQIGMLDYLGGTDPVARLHLLIVPMKINGMENFGLLNVRESLWPASPNATLAAVQRFEKTLLHEMGHQWFGNLVTMEWWDGIWLAESLTTFLASQRPIVFDPTTDLSVTAIVDANWAMAAGTDGGGRISAIPGIVYTKGAALLEMLDALIGPERMQRLLRHFVREFQFKSANTNDFLAVLEQTMANDDDGATNDEEDKWWRRRRRNNFQAEEEMLPSFASLAVHFLHRWLVLPSHPIVFVDFDADLGQLCLTQTPKMVVKKGTEEERNTYGKSNKQRKQQQKQRWRRQVWPIPIWVECLEGTRPEQLLWIPDTGDAQLVIPLRQLTATNSTRALAFNRNRSVYYQLSIRAAQHRGGEGGH